MTRSTSEARGEDLSKAMEPSWDPRTGSVASEATTTPTELVESLVERAAASSATLGRTAPSVRAKWLREIADTLEHPTVSDELLALADRETALGRPRLAGELGRTASQLRFYAGVAEEGSFLQATIDRETGIAPSLARWRMPLGPVAVFGASNFPFAFGVLGNDTAAALAAGCPVVAKGHPAHPLLSQRLAAVAKAALIRAGAPFGAFSIVSGFAAGTALVTSRHTAAVAFTGSQHGGLALWRLANTRDVVIPVYAEMGTVNPVVVTPEGAKRMTEIADGAVESFTLGAGQFCTKPGLLLAPHGSDAGTAVAGALKASQPVGWHLTEEMAAAATVGVKAMISAGGELLATTPGPDCGWAAQPTVLTAPIGELKRGSSFLQECFGPVLVVSEYRDQIELQSALDELQGALAATIMPGSAEDAEIPALLAKLTPIAGRVTVGDWPTGVAWTWAQQHGGPWPATTAPATTSVGAAALDRFTRPVAYQSAPDRALPTALQEANAWRLPRRVDGVLHAAPEAFPLDAP